MEPYRYSQGMDSYTRLDHFQQASIRFIRSVRTAYDTETASKVVTALSDALGKEWSTKLIYDMVVGPEHSLEEGDIVVTCLNMINKIQMIKAVRAVSGMGLKEAKDAVEGLEARVKPWLIGVTFANPALAPTLILPFKPYNTEISRTSYISELRSAGFVVHE